MDAEGEVPFTSDEIMTLLLACSTALHHIPDPEGIGTDRVSALKNVMTKLENMRTI